MPRVSSRPKQPDVNTGSYTKLRQCLQALVTGSDEICLDNELGCAGCGGSSYLVDSLCAFCLHSDAARRYFVASGGLDALLFAGRKRQSEKTILSALTILQCLCSTQLGQKLVVTRKPDLLQLVCDYAYGDEDDDNDGVQYAALSVLADWVSEPPDSQVLAWLLQCATTASPQGNSAVASKRRKPEPTETMVFGEENGSEEEAIPDSPQRRVSSPQDPAVLHIAEHGLLQSTLAVRKAASQLFAALVTNTALEVALPAAIARLNDIVTKVQQLLCSERASIGVPHFAAFANGRSSLLLDPMAFLCQQEQVQRQKHLCHALLHLASDIGTSPTCAIVLGQVPTFLCALFDIFESSWQVSTASTDSQRVSLLPGDVPFSFLQDHQSRELALDALVVLLHQPGMLACLGRAISDSQVPANNHPTSNMWSPSVSVAFSTINLQQPVPVLPSSTGALPAMPDMSRPGVTDAVANMQQRVQLSEWDAEEVGLSALMQLVHRLLKQQTAGHVRAALVLLGNVRFDQAPKLSGPTAGYANAVDGSVHSRWLRVLCQLFDAAWRSEVAEAQRAQAEQLGFTGQSTPPLATQSEPPYDAASVQSTTGAYPSSVAHIDLTVHPPVAAPPSTCVPVQPAAVSSSTNLSTGEQDEGQLTAFMFNVGLGYRVLVQVLQSWKNLSTRGAPCVLSELERSGYVQRALLATTHTRPCVAQAALKVLARVHSPQVASNQLSTATNQQQVRQNNDNMVAWDNWNSWSGLSRDYEKGSRDIDAAELAQLNDSEAATQQALISGGAMPPPPASSSAPQVVETAQADTMLSGELRSEDQDMQEFLAVFLDSSGGQENNSTEAYGENGMLVSLTDMGEAASASQAPPAAVTYMSPTTLVDTTQGPHTPISARATTDTSAPQQSRQGTQTAASLFTAWGAAEDEQEERVLQEALTLLPDLDNLAQTVCVKYDNIPSPNKRLGAAMASPLAMLML